MSWVWRLLGWVRWKLWRTTFRARDAADLPDEIAARTVYVVGGREENWCAVLLCPCGCLETIQLALLKGGRFRWVVSTDRLGAPSIRPSVWRVVGCKSHFVMRCGRVVWCGDHPSADAQL